MADPRHLSMLALAVATGVVAVLAVGMLSPSTSMDGPDPLAAAAEAVPGKAPNRTSTTGPSSTDAQDPSRPPGTALPGKTTPGATPHGGPAAGPSTRRLGPDGQPLPDPPLGITPRRAPPPGQGDAASAGGPGAGGEEAGPPDGFRDQASADRADWLEDRMNAFVDTLIPEAGAPTLSRSCADHGRTCTFEGPATDDFAARWVRALSYGDMNEDTLQGTNLRDFSFYESDDGLRFSITARHPESR